MSILKVGVLAVAGVLLAVQFKNGKTEYSTYISAIFCFPIFKLNCQKNSGNCENPYFQNTHVRCRLSFSRSLLFYSVNNLWIDSKSSYM